VLVGAAAVAGIAALGITGGIVGGMVGEWLGNALEDEFQNLSYCPLVFDLDGDGLEFVSVGDSAALFDLDNDGFALRTAWVNSDDALHGGFSSLSALDSNFDGLITAADARFEDLKLWRDLRQDGYSAPGELTALSAAGITSISLSLSLSLSLVSPSLSLSLSRLAQAPVAGRGKEDGGLAGARFSHGHGLPHVRGSRCGSDRPEPLKLQRVGKDL
jgi:hypothetical protein